MKGALRVLLKVNSNIERRNSSSFLSLGHCKRVYFSYSFPKNKAYRVKHIIQNKNFANAQYFTFCGMYHRVRMFKQFHKHFKEIIAQVGANLPCTSAKDIAWSPMPPYENYTLYKDISNFTTTTPWDSNVAYDAQKYAFWIYFQG